MKLMRPAATMPPKTKSCDQTPSATESHTHTHTHTHTHKHTTTPTHTTHTTTNTHPHTHTHTHTHTHSNTYLLRSSLIAPPYKCSPPCASVLSSRSPPAHTSYT